MNIIQFKTLSLLSVLLIVTACGSKDSDSSSSDQSPSSSNTETNPTTTEEVVEVIPQNNQPASTSESEPVTVSTDNLSTTDTETTDSTEWIQAREWTNLRVPEELEGNMNISFDARPLDAGINGVISVTNGAADVYDDLALIVRFNASGYIDTRDGDSYHADMELPYTANEVYTFTLNADFNTQVYDVYVTYPSGQQFPVRLAAGFRTTQQISSADYVVMYESYGDDLEISNFRRNEIQVALAEENASAFPTNDTADTASTNEAEAAEPVAASTSSSTSNNNQEPQTTTNNTSVSNPLVNPDNLSVNTGACYANLPEVEVRNDAELRAALDATSGGGKILVHPGQYSCLDLEGRNYSSSAPLLIEGIGENNTDAIFTANCSLTIDFDNSSYIRIKNIGVRGGLSGITANRSHHIIIDGLDISETRQGGIHIHNDSTYVDIINNEVYGTGVQNSQWGECIYVGTGWDRDFPDVTTNVWIENNHIHHCGFGEGINIKQEVFDTTIRGNYIHDILPGNPAHTQHNHAAITYEPGRGEDPSTNYNPNERRDIWIENNTIENVSFGRWAHGIMIGGWGVHVLNNTINNVEESGIWSTGWANMGHTNYIAGNTITNAAQGDFRIDPGVDVITAPPANGNPNAPQNWLCE
jgi:hypothetical protein